MMTSRAVNYSSVSCGSCAIESCWKEDKGRNVNEISCQTTDELFEFDESGTQTTYSKDAETQFSEQVSVYRAQFYCLSKKLIQTCNLLIIFSINVDSRLKSYRGLWY